MPIDSSRYANSNSSNYSHSYANKYQDIAPTTHSSWSSNPSGSSSSWSSDKRLSNTKSRDLNAELHLAGAALNPRTPKAQLVNVNQPKDLGILDKPTSLNKFVLTQGGQMVVGNIDKSVPTKWLSHPAIAELGAGPGQSQHVVSAGYIKKDFMGNTRLSHTSGHYLPTKDDLKPAQQHLKDMGVTSTKNDCSIV
ncbi:hypothetical protein [Pseudomonas rhodesiae]|jgi:hypothetical protein|uniref:hypothetical protein n=1 Tax=Pseudomonas rhodesiae TaxID=76760 RepID=UPI001093517D|nr:hypothetical protein [Pseudomonas rhodesiae]QVN00284.1 hypothetical protein JYG38_18930 [Pseudomonas rhodesiae]TGY19469.1 hypothetical protein E5845_06925 [Pseudomonas fluorescens]WLG38120.1 hypothetical protein PSH93_19315 [Pseudomonas rhodesiae]